MRVAIGERIRELRESRKLSQEDVASSLGYSRQRLARIESGDADISYDAIYKIAKLLGVNTDDITAVASAPKSFNLLFRGQEGAKLGDETERLFEMIELIYANKRLYNRTRRDDASI